MIKGRERQTLVQKNNECFAQRRPSKATLKGLGKVKSKNKKKREGRRPGSKNKSANYVCIHKARKGKLIDEV